MDVISFAWTTAALVAGQKSRTRRDWRPSYAERFHVGQEIAAYDRSRRNGGTQIGTIRLTADPVRERMSDMPDLDYWREGFAWIDKHPEFAPKKIFGEPAGPDAFTWDEFLKMRSIDRDETLWVVEFEIVEIKASPFTAAQLLRPEIAATAEFWAKSVGDLAATIEQVSIFRQTLINDLAACLAHEPKWGYRSTANALSTIVAPVFDVTRNETFADDLLQDAIEAAGLDRAISAFDLPVASVCAWPGFVEAQRPGGVETLFDCTPPFFEEPETRA